MISTFEQVRRVFEEIDKNLHKKIQVYMIGGAMLLYHKIKPATKDIDIIVANRSEFETLQTVLKKLHFTTKVPTFEYKKVDLSQIFIRDDLRIDVFHKIVCKGFLLSDPVMKRAEKIMELENLSLFLCFPEDVFIFKTFTERDGDIEDCLRITDQKKLDWNAILEEINTQIQTSGNKVWITWIGERLDILEERGLNIPIMKDVDALREKFFADFEKTHAKKSISDT